MNFKICDFNLTIGVIKECFNNHFFLFGGGKKIIELMLDGLN